MTEYYIKDLSPEIRKFINDNKIDKNENGIIDTDNGELSTLLSGGKIKEVEMHSSDWPMIGVAGTGLSFCLFGPLGDVLLKYCPKKLFNKIDMGSALLFGLGSIASWAFALTCKEKKLVMDKPLIEENVPQNQVKNQYRQVFGEDTELKEYTPQKGEYWTSILKAKYGVDEKIAQRMAHRIKDVIYEDSLAAKQTPVMYLPTTWTFEGKTYTYNDSAKAERTDNYSDNVKTEMGKMSKDIKY